MSIHVAYRAHLMMNLMLATRLTPVRLRTKNETIPRITKLRETERKKIAKLANDQKTVERIRITKLVRKLSRLKVSTQKTNTTRTKKSRTKRRNPKTKRRNPKMNIPADRKNPITVRIVPMPKMMIRKLKNLANREVKNLRMKVPMVKIRRVKTRGIKSRRVETRRRVKVPRVKRPRVKIPRVKTRRIKINLRIRRKKMIFGP